VLVVDVDAALTGLLAEWLAPLGVEVREERDAVPGARYDLLIVDLPFPRQDAARRVERVMHEHPDTPIIAVSAAFFSNVVCCGAMACTLGVVGVLPKPVPREDLLSIVQRLLHR
jgi:CheY-like chemotaxis protein